jgi:phosphoenolpyruvate carboxykinase (ATP)
MRAPHILDGYELDGVDEIYRNAPPALLYEHGILFDGARMTKNGALVLRSGEKTGRSPSDKRIVNHPDSRDDVWWGPVNVEIDPDVFAINRQRAVDYLNTVPRLYVVDGYAGWDEVNRLKVRIVCERPYHALFMHNMLVRPTLEELESFGEPDFVVFNAGRFPANRHTRGMTSSTSVDVSFEEREMVILGTQYAGEMKKGVFTVMNYLMPKQGHLSMHCSATEGARPDDVALFFGLSGTGKTTLSANPERKLIGDDEHVWTPEGVFNIEGGCYAKTIDLSAEKEPEIYGAIRYGTVLENVIFDERTREVDWSDDSITQNTRASYPLHYIEDSKIPATAGHPQDVVFLTADAFGVLPPVARLTAKQAMYHFISGYTAKVAGTEVGVEEPQATFSACFGAPFLVWHPFRYAEILGRKMEEHGARVWLVNTGWTGGPHGTGHRIDLPHTRAIVDAIHHGDLDDAPTEEDPVFGFQVPTRCPGVPSEILIPRNTWDDPDAYDTQRRELAERFIENFRSYEEGSSEATRAAGPTLD